MARKAREALSVTLGSRRGASVVFILILVSWFVVLAFEWRVLAQPSERRSPLKAPQAVMTRSLVDLQEQERFWVQSSHLMILLAEMSRSLNHLTEQQVAGRPYSTDLGIRLSEQLLG